MEELFSIKFYTHQFRDHFKTAKTKFIIVNEFIRNNIKEFEPNYSKFIDIDYLQKKHFSGMFSIDQLFNVEEISKENIKSLFEYPTNDSSSFISVLGLNIKRRKQSIKRDGSYEHYTIIEICPNTLYAKMANKTIVQMDDDNVTQEYASVDYIPKRISQEKWFLLKNLYYDNKKFICLGSESNSFYRGDEYIPVFNEFYNFSFILTKNGFAWKNENAKYH